MMARVTRSKKVQVAEDQTAAAAQIQLPETPQPPKQPLAALPIANNAMPSIEDSGVEQELKGLKAAYRFAIGGGRKSKRNKIKSAAELSATTSPVVAAAAPWVLPPDLTAHIAAKKQKQTTVQVKEVQEETIQQVQEDVTAENQRSHKQVILTQFFGIGLWHRIVSPSTSQIFSPSRPLQCKILTKFQQEELDLQKVLNEKPSQQHQSFVDNSRQFSASTIASLFSQLAIRDLTQHIEKDLFPATDSQPIEESTIPAGRTTRSQQAKLGELKIRISLDNRSPVRQRHQATTDSTTSAEAEDKAQNITEGLSKALTLHT
jgi:hypothetical protein